MRSISILLITSLKLAYARIGDGQNISEMSHVSARKLEAETCTPSVNYQGTLFESSCNNCSPKVDTYGNTAVATTGDDEIQFNSLFVNQPFDINSSIRSVSMSGNYAAVGTPFGGGAVHIFETTSSSSLWRKVAKITPPGNINRLSRFGTSVDIDNDVMVIGATHVAGNSITNAGAAFIYRRLGDGTWNLEATLTSNDPYELSFNFGFIVSVKGNFVVIGEYTHSNRSGGHNSIFEFDSQSSSWVQIDDSITNDECDYNYYGRSIELTNNNGFLLGCKGNNNYDGAVFYYLMKETSSGRRLELQQKITSSESGGIDFFGVRMALDENVLVVSEISNEGKAFVFTRNQDDDAWNEVAIIKSPEGSGAAFGKSVAVSGDNIIIASTDQAYYYKYSC